MAMKPKHLKLANSNPMHFQKAIKAATLSIMDDRRLTGIPSVRTSLAEIAALRALGAQDATIDKKVYGSLHEENLDPVMEALNTAMIVAKAEIAGLPPIRGR